MSEALKAEQLRLEQLAREHAAHMSNIYNQHVRDLSKPKALPLRPCC